MQQQRTPRPQIDHQQHHVPPPNPQQDLMDASSLLALASHRLCHHQGKGQTGRVTDQGHVWRRLLDRPPSDHL